MRTITVTLSKQEQWNAVVAAMWFAIKFWDSAPDEARALLRLANKLFMAKEDEGEDNPAEG